MKSPKVVIGFATLSDGNLEIKALSIVDAMTDNANFPTPDPTLSDVNAAITDYSNALSGAKTRDKTQVAVKNIKRKALISLLKDLASYVNFTAKGDKSIIMSSGFDAGKEGISASTVTSPTNFKITPGMNAGQATTSIRGVKAARTYVHQCTPDPITDASVWQNKFVTTRSYTFDGLASGKKYWFRVGVIGSGGQVLYSDPLSLIIQ
jgi:hypothetical protein